MNLLLHLLSAPVLGTVAVFLAIIWMLRDEKDKTRPLLVFALVINLFYGLMLTLVMGKEDSFVPWKYDYVLYNLDKSMGISTAFVAAKLQGALRIPLLIVYQLMVPMMIVWFLIIRSTSTRADLVRAYVVELVIGPVLYAIVPACGPIFIFGSQWLRPSGFQAEVVRFAGMPNAFPSLHIATAFVFVLMAPSVKTRIFAIAFLIGTALATIATGEHFAIDLVPGLVFGCFAVNAGSKLYQRAVALLAIVLLWSLSVRFAYHLLLSHPVMVQAMVSLTLASAAVALFIQWRMPILLLNSTAVAEKVFPA